MMCGCGQDANTTHACGLLNGPRCQCGAPLWQTHCCTMPSLVRLEWPWWHFTPRPYPAATSET